MTSMIRVAGAGILVLGMAVPAAAQQDDPVLWPTIRYGWPDKLAAGVAVQPPLPGRWDLLIGSVTAGTGGLKAGVGIGRFGHDIMAGYGLQITVLRTWARPDGADPHQTFVGVEAEVMAANISIKAGPAIRLGDRSTSAGRIRLNVSVGYGF